MATAVMTMSDFRVAPRVGHLDRVRRICGYLSKMRYAMIRIRAEEPKFSDLPDMQYDWSRSTYGELTEVLSTDAPRALGSLTLYVNASLMHDVIMGSSVMESSTSIGWYSKKQSIVADRSHVRRTRNEPMHNSMRYLGL